MSGFPRYMISKDYKVTMHFIKTLLELLKRCHMDIDYKMLLPIEIAYSIKYNRKRRMIRSLIETTGSSLITILLCVLILPFTEYITRSIFYILFLIIIALSIGIYTQFVFLEEDSLPSFWHQGILSNCVVIFSAHLPYQAPSPSSRFVLQYHISD